jgi:hypothetical protein
MWIQPQNKQMKYHKQMPMWIKQFIIKQIQPLLIARSNSHSPFGVEAYQNIGFVQLLHNFQYKK